MATNQDLIKHLAQEKGIKMAEATEIFEIIYSEIIRKLKVGDKVFTPIGSFSAYKRQARNGRNPRTGAIIHIKATNSVSFRAFQILRDAVN